MGARSTTSSSLLVLDPHAQVQYISRGRSVLAMGTDGVVRGVDGQGLWVRQTRLLSLYRWLVNGGELALAGSGTLGQDSWLGYYIARPGPRKASRAKPTKATQQTLELRLSRRTCNGLVEEARITNWTQTRTVARLSLEVEADFADPAEAGTRRVQRGKMTRRWSRQGAGHYRLAFEYHAQHRYRHQGEHGTAHLHRGLTLDLQLPRGHLAQWSGHGIEMRLPLAPRGTVPIQLRWTATVDGHAEHPSDLERLDHKSSRFLRSSMDLAVPAVPTLAGTVRETFERAKSDLSGLRLDDLDRGRDGWTIAGGVPLFVAFFGRDSLIAARQALPLGPAIARGTLAVHAARQATERNDWRDEQPGRLIHELHTNPLSVLGFDPHGRYYGDITAPMSFPILLEEFWRWTGDAETVRLHLETARRALRWADENAQTDGDGFYAFKTRSTQGAKNQIWKDSDDAIVYPDGSQVPDPIASCETQGYVYAAKVAMATLLHWTGDSKEASTYALAAERLKRRFNDVYWLPRAGTFAMGLDRDKRPIATVASDPCHCLGTGIVDEPRAGRLAARLMRPDLFSGWGLRTLSAEHPAYDPFSYHRGSVWPVENAIFAMAFSRFGFRDHLHRLVRAQFEAASLFRGHRLPELFAGHPRDDLHPFPGLYPPANAPQAWSASAIVALIQALLGLTPFAPGRILFVDPMLPDWLPELTLQDLRVGAASVSLRFHRTSRGDTAVSVLALDGDLQVLRRPRPWLALHGASYRMRDRIAALVRHAQVLDPPRRRRAAAPS